MRPRLLGITLGVALAVAGSAGLLITRRAANAVRLDDACRTPALVLNPAARAPKRGVAVVFHGLSANAGVMQPLGQSLANAGWRVFLLDLPGHGASTQPFAYDAVDRCAAAAVEFLEKSGQAPPNRTMLVGHSLGAATAVRLADLEPMPATVAISPALLVLPRREPSNLLVLTGQFDLAEVKKTAKQLLRAAGGRRVSPADFAERRAMDERTVSGQLHGPMALDPRVWRMTIEWGGEAMGAAVSSRAAERAIAGPEWAMACNLALIFGLALLVAPLESGLARVLSMPRPAPQPRGQASAAAGTAGMRWRDALVRWAVAAFFATALLGLLNAAKYLRPVRMDDGDWAALAAVVTGAVLLALCRGLVGVSWRMGTREALFAALAGAATLAVFVAALNWDLGELTLNAARLWRLLVLLAFTLPYFVVEETALGPPGGGRRFLLFLGMRVIVWLAQVFALVVFWRSGLILVLMLGGFALVSIGQRLGADALRKRGAGPAAAALFDAILAAGMLALILPLT